MHICVIGQDTNYARICQHSARGAAEDVRGRGFNRLLQGLGAALVAPDPLHDDEVRLLRAHRRTLV